MLTVNRRILISAPHDSVRRFLGDLNQIAEYEPKVDSITVDPSGEATAAGRFWGMPWRGTFRFVFGRDGGYQGVMTSGPLRHMECRIALRPVNGGTLLDHDEEYVLPFFLRPCRTLIRRWLERTLETELDHIKEGAEALNRRLQLEILGV
ncbi:MAG: SRPBCC family protein [Elusimicrobiota bacterium]